MRRALASLLQGLVACLLCVYALLPTCGCGARSDLDTTADAGAGGASVDGAPLDATLGANEDGAAPSPEAGAQEAGPTCATVCPDGCCDARGACQAGTQTAACGFGGQACSDCATAGLTCIAALGANPGGSCGSTTPEDGGSACGPATCPGCCSGGACVAGNIRSQCGSHGQACTSCAGAGLTCQAQGSAGACVGSRSACSPSNCAGCCDALGVCQDAPDIGACGTGGLSCTYCDPGEACLNGACQPVAGCNAANCVGCCQSGVCLSGVAESACGSNGAACAACDPESPSSQCLPLGLKNGGACSNPTDSCSAATCPGGCCDSNGVCHPYSPFYCGQGTDDQCTTCRGSCFGGVCSGTDCNASNCTGCCMPDGMCWTGAISDAHCGAASAGSVCIACGTGYQCNLGATPPENPSCVLTCMSEGNCGG